MTRTPLRLALAGLIAALCGGCLSVLDTGPSVVLLDARTEPDTAVMQRREQVRERGPVISARN